MSDIVLRASDLEMNTDTKKVTRGGKPINLTPKEFQLLHLLLLNKGKVISRTEIAEKVWSVSFDTGTNVIDVYVNYLRNKIDKGYSQKLIHTVVGMGYSLDESDPL